MDTTTATLPAPPLPPSARSVPPRLVAARDLTRIWGRGAARQVGIDQVDLDVGRGELLAVVGPSGSGKSTLGALIAGIDAPTSGSLVVGETRIDRLSGDRLAAWRAEHVGIVFQDFHLLPTLSALENVELALQLSGRRRRGRSRVARETLGRVGLGDKARRLPAQLSGGERQRVGIARAIAADPDLIVADEPTGSLDQRTGHEVFDLLLRLTGAGTTVVLITHDLALADAADRTVTMIDGALHAGVVVEPIGGAR